MNTVVEVIQPLREAGVDYVKGDRFSVQPERAARLADLRLVQLVAAPEVPPEPKSPAPSAGVVHDDRAAEHPAATKEPVDAASEEEEAVTPRVGVAQDRAMAPPPRGKATAKPKRKVKPKDK